MKLFPSRSDSGCYCWIISSICIKHLLNNRIYLFQQYPLPISRCKSVLSPSVIGLSTLQDLQMNDWLALSRLPFTPLHRLWIHFLQLWHKIELLSTPFLHTPQGHLPFSSTLSFILQLYFLYSSSHLWLPNPISILLSYHEDFLHSLPSRSSHLHTIFPEANLLVALW